MTFAGRLDRPCPRFLAPIAALALLILPGYLFWDQLQGFRLRDDDFAWLIACRTGEQPLANLFDPHRGQFVPLFRLLTGLVAMLAGSPGNVPLAMGVATYSALALLMLGVGHLAAWETRRVSVGLIAIALTGITSVVEPAATWYSAGQTLWAGLAVVGALVFAQTWRIRGGTWPLVFSTLTCLAAPWVAAGGLAAGPACAAYLRAGRQQGSRRPALLLVTASAASGLVVAAIGLRSGSGDGPSAGSVIADTLRALPESLIFRNLGLDVSATAVQGGLLTLAIAAAWAWSRRGQSRPNPLEAAGTVIVVLAYLIAGVFQGNGEFSRLARLDGSDTIPHVGAVLFILGWWAGLSGLGHPGRPARATIGGLLLAAGLAGTLLVLHIPRVNRLTIAEAPPLSASERERFLIEELWRLRARYLLAEDAARQSRFLIRMAKAAEYARRQNLGREPIRAAFGRVEAPGWPRTLNDRDGLDLFAFPESGRSFDPGRDRAALTPLLAPEPFRPPWLETGEPWPPIKDPSAPSTPNPVAPAGDGGDDGDRRNAPSPRDGPPAR